VGSSERRDGRLRARARGEDDCRFSFLIVDCWVCPKIQFRTVPRLSSWDMWRYRTRYKFASWLTEVYFTLLYLCRLSAWLWAWLLAGSSLPLNLNSVKRLWYQCYIGNIKWVLTNCVTGTIILVVRTEADAEIGDRKVILPVLTLRIEGLHWGNLVFFAIWWVDARVWYPVASIDAGQRYLHLYPKQ